MSLVPATELGFRHISEHTAPVERLVHPLKMGGLVGELRLHRHQLV